AAGPDRATRNAERSCRRWKAPQKLFGRSAYGREAQRDRQQDRRTNPARLEDRFRRDQEYRRLAPEILGSIAGAGSPRSRYWILRRDQARPLEPPPIRASCKRRFFL